MNKLVSIVLFFFGFILLTEVSAAEVSYVGSVTGIDCTGCKKSIAQSLGKIKGVKTIQITKESEGLHRLVVLTDGTVPISKAAAIKALDKHEHTYKITAWNKAG